MHEDLGTHAGRTPDPTERAYRVDVLLDRVTELDTIALMHRIADLLVEEGLATPEEADVRSVVTVHEVEGSEELPAALHMVVPKEVPQSPDLGAGYSPN